MQMKVPVLLMAREIEAGGSERQLVETALGLDRSRFEPYVGVFRPSSTRAGQLRAAGVPLVHFPVYSFRSPMALVGAWRLARFIRAHQIRLVHAFDAPLAVYATPVTRYLTSAVMLSSQRGHRELTPEYRKLLRWTDRRVDGIVVNCEYMRRHLTEEEGVPERLVRVCYNGIDLERFHSAPMRHPEAVPRGDLPPEGITDDAFVVGSVCMLRPEKGLTTLIDAFARVRHLRKRMKLVLVGSGSEFESLQAHARQAGIFDDCVWQPATPEVAGWLHRFDIFVLPSLTEALSNSLMEAMACGRPVIASDVGGNPELIESGTRGLLFESRNVSALAGALTALLCDEQLRLRLGVAAESFIRQRFSREASAARMGEVYESFLESRSS
jgi:glycosyltransferase involved in cell wall biosynthesis